ncbi:MAG: hypothetical protein M3250_03450 [Thermoproteota archaeon]|nr:hypothetical protein [Thermoproteota archaeon]
MRCNITYNRPLSPIYGNTNATAGITNNYLEVGVLLAYLYASSILATIIAIPTIGIILIFQSVPLIGLGIAIVIHSILLLYSKTVSRFIVELVIE